MKKANVGIIMLSAVLVATSIGWIIYQSQQRRIENGWVSVRGWSGSEAFMKTEPFSITGEKWRIQLALSCPPEARSIVQCDVTIYRDGEGLVESVSFVNDKNEAYFDMQGTFYLIIRRIYLTPVVSSSHNQFYNPVKWSVSVSEFR